MFYLKVMFMIGARVEITFSIVVVYSLIGFYKMYICFEYILIFEITFSNRRTLLRKVYPRLLHPYFLISIIGSVLFNVGDGLK